MTNVVTEDHAKVLGAVVLAGCEGETTTEHVATIAGMGVPLARTLLEELREAGKLHYDHHDDRWLVVVGG